jgi:23S rRNA (pseudouridine1915-N3)-methyltransferase
MPRAFPRPRGVEAEPRDRGKPVPQLLAAEAVRIAAACQGAGSSRWTSAGNPGPRGCSLTRWRWRDESRDAAFVIGSADGLAEEVKRDAAAVVAISALTLPHGLVRILVAEQLYRAVSLLAGHPYHRE